MNTKKKWKLLRDFFNNSTREQLIAEVDKRKKLQEIHEDDAGFVLPTDDTGKKWDRPCMSPSHNFPTHLYIPPGKAYTHTCPDCGHQTTATTPIINC